MPLKICTARGQVESDVHSSNMPQAVAQGTGATEQLRSQAVRKRLSFDYQDIVTHTGGRESLSSVARRAAPAPEQPPGRCRAHGC